MAKRAAVQTFLENQTTEGTAPLNFLAPPLAQLCPALTFAVAPVLRPLLSCSAPSRSRSQSPPSCTPRATAAGSSGELAGQDRRGRPGGRLRGAVSSSGTAPQERRGNRGGATRDAEGRPPCAARAQGPAPARRGARVHRQALTGPPASRRAPEFALFYIVRRFASCDPPRKWGVARHCGQRRGRARVSPIRLNVDVVVA